jgi:hypothetical protein
MAMTDSSTRYLAVPFRAHPIGDNEVLLRAAGADSAQRLMLGLAQILSTCNNLDTLAALAEAARQKLGAGTAQLAGIHHGLEQLVQAGLLQPESGLHGQLTQHHHSPVEIGQLFIRSCDRPEDLDRLLTSLETHHQQGHQLPAITVVDDSRQAAHIERNRSRVELATERLGQSVRHIDRAARRAQVETIAERSGGDAEALRWLVDGDADHSEPSYGSTLNFALLLSAGQGMLVMDDDAELAPYALSAPASTDITLHDHQALTIGALDAQRDELEQATRLPLDAVMAHGELIGAALGTTMSAGAVATLKLDGLSPALAHELKQAPRIKLTGNGTLGDAGVSSLHGLLAERGSQLAALAQQGPEGRQHWLSRRYTRSVSALQLAPAWQLMTTTLTGVDNSELLLPTIVHGRNEDLLFGEWLKFMHPNSLIATLPWMLPHRRHSTRAWDDSALDQVAQPSVARLLSDLLSQQPKSPSTDATTRAEHAAHWLADLAHQDRASLTDRCQAEQLERKAEVVEGLRRNRDLADPPAWLAADFQRAISAVLNDAAHPPVDALQHYAGRYAKALPAWVKAWQWCQSHPQHTHG